ncbi:Phosphoheptose isomerase [Solimonas aquatica]|uniref:Phosphoheptose isomerase n=1 Tax=Solimonas aquatica TaxID=489703 RepID=A0A1H9BUQ6_9GAMM|nr:SIS domain-containing protein [Solimonas aquatica]SEP92567.1 Phosphoheptose isomerase [Solimonas aquatica]
MNSEAGTNWNLWLDDYYRRYAPVTQSKEVYESLIKFRDLALAVKASKSKLMMGGNGASASIAAHGAVDFTKQAKVTSLTFSDANLITCFANDYGYDNWLARAFEHYGRPGDAAVLISVSGKSPSVVRAAEYAREQKMPVVTFTGKSADNPLRKLGDINFFIDSAAYNVVECIHMIWLTTVVDMVVGRAEYSV